MMAYLCLVAAMPRHFGHNPLLESANGATVIFSEAMIAEEEMSDNKRVEQLCWQWPAGGRNFGFRAEQPFSTDTNL